MIYVILFVCIIMFLLDIKLRLKIRSIENGENK